MSWTGMFNVICSTVVPYITIFPPQPFVTTFSLLLRELCLPAGIGEGHCGADDVLVICIPPAISPLRMPVFPSVYIKGNRRMRKLPNEAVAFTNLIYNI